MNRSRATEFDQDWVATGKTPDRERNIITSLDLQAVDMEKRNLRLQAKYTKMKEEEVRFEEIACEDAEYLLVAYGSSARICQKTVQLAREKGIKAGLLRPITLFPYPTEYITGNERESQGDTLGGNECRPDD